MQNFSQTVVEMLGIGREPNSLSFTQIALRALIIFIMALVMVRLADRRFLSKKTAFDAILGFILASMLARAVNGSAAFFPTIGGGFVLVALHRLVAIAARHSPTFGTWVKGRSDLVIENGKVQIKAMRENDLSERDLLEALRLNGHVEDPNDVKAAYLERSGDISIIPRTK